MTLTIIQVTLLCVLVSTIAGLYARDYFRMKYHRKCIDAENNLSSAVIELHESESKRINAEIERDELIIKYRKTADELKALQITIEEFKGLVLPDGDTPIRVAYINFMGGFDVARSRQEADLFTNNTVGYHRVACVRMLYREGQFDA